MMTPEEYRNKLDVALADPQASVYAVFQTATFAKIANDALCEHACEEILIINGNLDERLYKDALDSVCLGVKIRVIITQYGPHWDIPGDVEARYVDEPDENCLVLVDMVHWKYENVTDEIFDASLDDVEISGTTGIRKMGQISNSIFEDLWERATPIIM